MQITNCFLYLLLRKYYYFSEACRCIRAKLSMQQVKVFEYIFYLMLNNDVISIHENVPGGEIRKDAGRISEITRH